MCTDFIPTHLMSLKHSNPHVTSVINIVRDISTVTTAGAFGAVSAVHAVGTFSAVTTSSAVLSDFSVHCCKCHCINTFTDMICLVLMVMCYHCLTYSFEINCES